LKGDFSADLVPSRTAGKVQTVTKRLGPDIRSFVLRFQDRFAKLQNLGPSGAYRANFKVLLSIVSNTGGNIRSLDLKLLS
jgi:hypothetical protein